MKKILIKNGTIFTLDKNNKVQTDGAILLNDNKIEKVGTTVELEKEYENSADKVIDAKKRVVMPGFICGHMHFYSAFAKGIGLKEWPVGPNNSSDHFLDILEKLWWKLDKALLHEDVYYSALLGYIEALRSGTTTVIDHHASPAYIHGSLDEIEKAGREMGVRSNLCYEVTDRHGTDDENLGLKENERFIEKTSKNNDGMMSGLIGLHAAFTVSDSALEKSKELVSKYNTGVHIHVCEGQTDMKHSLEKYGITVIERLNKFNLLNNKSILAHCIHLDEKDFPIIKDTSPNIVHQPRSNMNNAVGSLDILNLGNKNVNFGLGTDGMSADMKAELIVANLIHKHVYQDNTVGTNEVYNALFTENPKIVERTMSVSVGKIESNYKADVIITDYIPPTPVSSNNVLGHIMFGVINGGIATTIIDGKIRMEEKIIPNLDEITVAKKCQELAQDVWDRMN